MPSNFWSQGSVVETLLQANFMLKRLNLQGRFANRSDVAEVVCLLENILANAPAQDEKNAKSVRTIIDVLQNIIRKEPHGETMDMHDMSSADAKGKQSSQMSEEASPPPGGRGIREEFDSFASARTKAIEDTIVPNADSFPSFKEIAGLQEAKTAMFEALVDPIRYPEYFKTGDLKPWKSVLLYGPPGTGKTILSQAIAKEIGGVLYQISSTDLISSWQGQSEKLIKELFDHAFTQKRAVVIFIDEVDSLCRVRSRTEDDSNRRVKTELLVQIQRLQSSTNLILICATNCPWELDPAFLRRLEKRIYAGLPDYEARHEILKAKLKSTVFDPSVGLAYLAQQSEGFSGDDLRRLASELAYAQFRKYKNSPCSRRSGSQGGITLSADDVHQELEKFQTSVDRHQLALYEQFMNRR